MDSGKVDLREDISSRVQKYSLGTKKIGEKCYNSYYEIQEYFLFCPSKVKDS